MPDIVPITGPIIYTHNPLKSLLAIAGPSVRAGFIDPPDTGLEIKICCLLQVSLLEVTSYIEIFWILSITLLI